MPKTKSQHENQSGSLPLFYEFSNGKISISWIDRDVHYKLDFGPNGYNFLPNIIGISKKSIIDTGMTQWTSLNLGATDWLPPIKFRVKCVEHPGKFFFTGGNHGSNGDASGERTGKNAVFQILIDGAPIREGNRGYCTKVSFFIVNELMAMNTIEHNDYILEQSLTCHFVAGCMSVSQVMRNLSEKEVVINRDYGPQMVAKGFDERMLILDGQNPTFQPFSGELNSGSKKNHPDAWAAITQSENGQQVSWIDKNYGIKNLSCVDPDAFLIKGSGTSTGKKIYQAAIHTDDTYTMKPGESYSWRGGYSWQADSRSAGNHIATFRFLNQDRLNFVAIRSASNYVVID